MDIGFRLNIQEQDQLTKFQRQITDLTRQRASLNKQIKDSNTATAQGKLRYNQLNGELARTNVQLKAARANFNQVQTATLQASGQIAKLRPLGQQVSAGMIDSFKKVGATLGVVFAVSTITNFIQSSLEAFDVQAKAEAQLLNALKGREDVQKRLIRQAQQLQGKTLFGDEATIEAQTLLASMGLTEKQITSLLPVVQDFATIMKVDLLSASKLVGKSIVTQTDALSRYIDTGLKGVNGEAERAVILQKKMEEAFGGAAEVAAREGTGRLTILKNALSDISETIGGELIQSINDFLDAFQKGDLKALGRLMVQSLVLPLELIIKSVEGLANVASKFLDNFGLGFKDLEKPLFDLGDEISRLLGLFDEEDKKRKINKITIKEETEGIKKQTAAYSDLQKQKAEDNNKSILDRLLFFESEEKLRIENQLGEATTDDERKKRIKELYAFTLQSQTLSNEQQIALYNQHIKDLEDVDKAAIARLSGLSSVGEGKGFTSANAGFLQRLFGLDDESFEEFKDNLEKAAYDAANQVTAISVEAAQRRNQRITDLTIQQLQDSADTELFILRDKLDKGQLTQEEFERKKTILDKQRQLKEQQAKRDQFNQDKRIKVAEAIANGFLAATQALSKTLLPFPASLSALIPVGLQTAIAVAGISATKFAKGGMLRGQSHKNGGIKTADGQMEFEGGEAVINKRSMSSNDVVTVTGTPKQIASNINAYRGFGKRFEKGGLVPINKFQSGNIIPTINTSRSLLSTSNQDVSAALRSLAGSFDRRIDRLEVINVAAKTSSVNKNTENLQSNVAF